MFSYILRQNRRILNYIEFYIYRPTVFYYIDTDEIPGFFLLLKNHIFITRSILTCEDIGVTMVTNFLEQKI